jgi:hypothetical protein
MIHRNLTAALVTAGAYIAGAVVLKLVEKAGLLPHDAVVRALGVFNGLALAVYANFLPKHVGRLRDPIAAMRWQSVLRVGGWAFMLGGLGYAATSLPPFPDTVPLALLSAATAYVLGYTVWASLECQTGGERPTLSR